MKLATTGSADTEDAADEDTPFKDLSGTDFDGNKVDGTLFSNNAVTVLNFWFYRPVNLVLQNYPNSMK